MDYEKTSVIFLEGEDAELHYEPRHKITRALFSHSGYVSSQTIICPPHSILIKHCGKQTTIHPVGQLVF